MSTAATPAVTPAPQFLREQSGANFIAVVFGRKRQGKTSYIKQFIRSHKIRRVVIFSDFRNDYGDIAKHSVNSLEQFQMLSMNGYWKTPEFSLRLRFFNLKLYNYAAAILQHVKHYLLVLDEIDVYCDARYMPNHLEALVLGSGNNSIDIFAAAKRPHMTPRLLTSQADDFIIFNTREGRDVAYINEWVGDTPPKSYKSLARGQFLHYSGEESWKEGRLSLPALAAARSKSLLLPGSNVVKPKQGVSTP